MKKQWKTTHIPEELKNLPNWVGFRIIPQKDKKSKKIPVDAQTGRFARCNAPETWCLFEEVLKQANVFNFNSIGFALVEPYVGIDIDHCVHEGVISPLAQSIITDLNSYTEFSPSKTGVHIICKGTLPQDRKLTSLNVEMYSRKRFLTFTGNVLDQTPVEIHDRSQELAVLYKKLEAQEQKNKCIQDIFRNIRKSKDHKTFFDLYQGNWQGHYPSQSEADLALCSKLAFYTDKNTSLIDELFRNSGLMRCKWDESHYANGTTYGQATIEKAVQSVKPASSGSTSGRLTDGEILTRDCEANVKNFLRDQQGNFLVVIPFESHNEVCSTDSLRFRNWKATRFRSQYQRPPRSESLKQACVQVEAKCYDSPQIQLYNRVGFYEDAIYYDLTTPDWKGVRIDQNGWTIGPLPPIFKRYAHQNKQILPIKGGNARELLEFCNIDPDDACLFLTSIASFFIPDIPHVILSQNGEQGTGKSSNSRRIKDLIDPSKVTLISAPKDLEQAQMIADKHWLCPFDNLSHVSAWFSDFLCRAVTGEGDMKRSLYTNDDEFIRSYKRCFVINGIGNLASRADLLDRSIVLDIPVLTQSSPEKEMDAKWRSSLPYILGGFFDVISHAMAIIKDIKGYERFRMSDFACWGAAIAEVMGYGQDVFFKQYSKSVDSKWKDTAEENTLVQKIEALLASHNGEWIGSATTLLEVITPETGYTKDLPKTARALSSDLMRIAPVLRNIGIDVSRSHKREGGTGRKLLILRSMETRHDLFGQLEEDVTFGVNEQRYCDHESNLNNPRPF